jgi:hypothetical protein
VNIHPRLSRKKKQNKKKLTGHENYERSDIMNEKKKTVLNNFTACEFFLTVMLCTNQKTFLGAGSCFAKTLENSPVSCAVVSVKEAGKSNHY